MRAYIATKDGGYVSTSDVEEDIEDEPTSNEDQMGVSLSSEDVSNQRIFIVQQVFSTQMEEAERLQCHNFF